MSIKEIQDKIQKGECRFSDHVVKRMVKRFIERSEVEDAIMRGAIIEEYPDDKYSPSCLIYGKTTKGRDLHVQVSDHQQLWLLQPMNLIQVSGLTVESGGDLR